MDEKKKSPGKLVGGFRRPSQNPKPRELTLKQKRFIELYNGNATEAAIKAGYAPKHAYQSGFRLLRQAEIKAAIEARTKKIDGPHIASREERQAFWTKIFHDESYDMAHRLRASELLARSQADFVERREVSYPDGIEVRVVFVGGDDAEN
jgi:phage terminase small subunit